MFPEKSESDRGNNQNCVNQVTYLHTRELSRCCPCEDKKSESGMNASKRSETDRVNGQN